MTSWHNTSGRPLSNTAWLEAHHQAKLRERTLFTEAILALRPETIVDLGCGPGIWLDLIDKHAPAPCELIGIDADVEAITTAERRAEAWKRRHSFLRLDIESDTGCLPKADVYLAFNIFPFVRHIPALLNKIRASIRHGGSLVVRQYDGGLLRFGPLDGIVRSKADSALLSSLISSEQFHHYDLDRVFTALADSDFARKEVCFETFQRVAPFPEEMLTYLRNSIEWSADLIRSDIGSELNRWLSEHAPPSNNPGYFVEVDMVAWLS